MSEITPNLIAEAAIPQNKNKEMRDLAVACLAMVIEAYKDIHVERVVKKYSTNIPSGNTGPF